MTRVDFDSLPIVNIKSLNLRPILSDVGDKNRHQHQWNYQSATYLYFKTLTDYKLWVSNNGTKCLSNWINRKQRVLFHPITSTFSTNLSSFFVKFIQTLLVEWVFFCFLIFHGPRNPPNWTIPTQYIPKESFVLCLLELLYICWVSSRLKPIYQLQSGHKSQENLLKSDFGAPTWETLKLTAMNPMPNHDKARIYFTILLTLISSLRI